MANERFFKNKSFVRDDIIKPLIVKDRKRSNIIKFPIKPYLWDTEAYIKSVNAAGK